MHALDYGTLSTGPVAKRHGCLGVLSPSSGFTTLWRSLLLAVMGLAGCQFEWPSTSHLEHWILETLQHCSSRQSGGSTCGSKHHTLWWWPTTTTTCGCTELQGGNETNLRHRTLEGMSYDSAVLRRGKAHLP